MKADRKSAELKLPAIQNKPKENKVLSSTLPDNHARLRPASLNKVEDLEKKLFSKLDAYEAVSRKGGSKRMKRGRVGEQNGVENEVQGYQKLQKLMPGLYSRLVEAKKGASYESTPATETPTSYKSLASFSVRDSTSTAESQRRQEKHTSIFITGKQEKQAEKYEISQQEMNQLYLDYIKKQNLVPETSSKELQDLGQSIVVCQREIAELTRSMEGLIREISIQCAFGAQVEQGK